MAVLTSTQINDFNSEYRLLSNSLDQGNVYFMRTGRTNPSQRDVGFYIQNEEGVFELDSTIPRINIPEVFNGNGIPVWCSENIAVLAQSSSALYHGRGDLFLFFKKEGVWELTDNLELTNISRSFIDNGNIFSTNSSDNTVRYYTIDEVNESFTLIHSFDHQRISGSNFTGNPMVGDGIYPIQYGGVTRLYNINDLTSMESPSGIGSGNRNNHLVYPMSLQARFNGWSSNSSTFYEYDENFNLIFEQTLEGVEWDMWLDPVTAVGTINEEGAPAPEIREIALIRRCPETKKFYFIPIDDRIGGRSLSRGSVTGKAGPIDHRAYSGVGYTLQWTFKKGNRDITYSSPGLPTATTTTVCSDINSVPTIIDMVETRIAAEFILQSTGGKEFTLRVDEDGNLSTTELIR